MAKAVVKLKRLSYANSNRRRNQPPRCKKGGNLRVFRDDMSRLHWKYRGEFLRNQTEKTLWDNDLRENARW